MNRLLTLACCLCLLAISAPAVQAAEAEAPDAAPAAERATPVPPDPAVELAPDATPMASCSNPSYGGSVFLPPYTGGGDPVAACTDRCAQNGDTFHSYIFLGRYAYDCFCCPG